MRRDLALGATEDDTGNNRRLASDYNRLPVRAYYYLGFDSQRFCAILSDSSIVYRGIIICGFPLV